MVSLPKCQEIFPSRDLLGVFVQSPIGSYHAVLHRGFFFCHLNYAFIRSWPLRKSMYLYLVSLRCFFRIIFYRSRLFGNRCNTAGCFPEEGTVCNFLDQSFWDRSSFGQRMMISFWDRSSFGQRVVSVEVDETESTWRFVIFTKKGGSGGRDIKGLHSVWYTPTYCFCLFQFSPLFRCNFSITDFSPYLFSEERR